MYVYEMNIYMTYIKLYNFWRHYEDQSLGALNIMKLQTCSQNTMRTLILLLFCWRPTLAFIDAAEPFLQDFVESALGMKANGIVIAKMTHNDQSGTMIFSSIFR